MIPGTIQVIPLEETVWKDVVITPARNVNAGAGKGKSYETRVRGGVAGLILDARGRPLQLPSDGATRVRKLREWLTAFNLPMP